MNKLIFLVFFSFFSVVTPSLSFATNASTLALSVVPTGVEFVANEISRTLLNGRKYFNVGNIKTSIDYGIDVYIEGINVELLVDGVQLNAESGRLDFQLKLKDAKVSIQKIRAEKDTFLGAIGINCWNTNLLLDNVSSNEGIPLKAEILAFVQNSLIKTSTQNIQFQLAENYFQVQGPRSCSGGPLEGFVKDIVRDALKGSRGKIEDLVRGYATSVSSFLDEQLNKLAHQTLDLNFSFPPVLPSIQIHGQTRPQMLDLSREGVRAELNWQQLMHNFDFQRFGRKGLAKTDSGHIHFGSTEISRDIFQQMIFKIYHQNRTYIEEELNGYLNNEALLLLAKENMQFIFPDLLLLQTDKEHLQLQLTAKNAPFLNFEQSSSKIFLAFQDLVLTFSYFKDNRWIPYYHLQSDLVIDLVPTIHLGILKMTLANLSMQNLQGHWDENHIPGNSHVYWDRLEEVLGFLSEIVREKRASFSYSLPEISFSEHAAVFDQLQLKAENLELSILLRKK